MREQSPHLIIQGNFAPAQSIRFMRGMARILGVLMFLFTIGALGVYGVKVHYEDVINKMARDTRDLNEQNKGLQVQFNHIRSYKNVETAATQVPHLHLAETIIDVPAAVQQKLPPMPHSHQEFPRIYGY